jgi:EAL domain-containing protein (putative c-di-GMP-specific phosphodiesterase class I)
MRTQVMLERAAGLPWLEREPSEGGEPERTPIPAFPFTIGRNESCDLPIQSTRISREHATIDCASGKYHIRDLGSTNGTFVNGERIEAAALEDGDIVLIADTEMTFYLGREEASEGMVTQVMHAARAAAGDSDLSSAIIQEVRRWHGALVQRAVECGVGPIVRLGEGSVFGYELSCGEDSCHYRSEAERVLLTTECRVASRLRRLRRMVAVEESNAWDGAFAFFVKLDASEIGSAGLIESIGRLHDAIAPQRRLVVEVPDSAVSDTPYYREFSERLHAQGVLIARDGFAAGPTQLAQQAAIRTDFVMLAKSMLRGIERSQERQRHMASLIEAGKNIECEIIAVGIRNAAEESACHELGCRFGQGELYRAMEPVSTFNVI